MDPRQARGDLLVRPRIKSLHHEGMKDIKGSSAGLAAAFGGTTSEGAQERESPVIKGLSRSCAPSLVVSPA
jgi:hypothetical protein